MFILYLCLVPWKLSNKIKGLNIVNLLYIEAVDLVSKESSGEKLIVCLDEGGVEGSRVEGGRVC